MERTIMAIIGTVLVTIAFVSFIIKWDFTTDIQIVVFSFLSGIVTITGAILIGMALSSNNWDKPTNTDPHPYHTMD